MCRRELRGGEVEGKVETFIPVASQGGKNMAAGDRPDGKIACFPLHVGRAVVLKNRLGRGCACVFVSRQRTHACLYQHRRVVIWLLCFWLMLPVIRYADFFPDETEAMPEFSANERVTPVTNGNLQGHVGLIDKSGKDRLRVVVRTRR